MRKEGPAKRRTPRAKRNTRKILTLGGILALVPSVIELVKAFRK